MIEKLAVCASYILLSGALWLLFGLLSYLVTSFSGVSGVVRWGERSLDNEKF